MSKQPDFTTLYYFATTSTKISAKTEPSSLLFKKMLPSKGSFIPLVGDVFGKSRLKVFDIIEDPPLFGANGQSGVGNENSLLITGTESIHGFPHAAQEKFQSITFFNLKTP